MVDELSRFVTATAGDGGRPGRSLADLRGEIIDGGDLMRLAETEICLAPLDARAKAMILEAAKRVSLVTAVSPRALVDVAYVVFEAGRLIRRLSELYGGRPGTLGFLRLARSVLAHLAVTGSIAVGDSFVQQIVGHGLAARLSAKLGEGRRQRHDDGTHRHRGNGHGAAAALHRAEAPGHGRFPGCADDLCPGPPGRAGRPGLTPFRQPR